MNSIHVTTIDMNSTHITTINVNSIHNTVFKDYSSSSCLRSGSFPSIACIAFQSKQDYVAYILKVNLPSTTWIKLHSNTSSWNTRVLEHEHVIEFSIWSKYLYQGGLRPSDQDKFAGALPRHMGHAYKHFPPHHPIPSLVTSPPTSENFSEHAFLTRSPPINALAGPAGQDKLAIALPCHVGHAYKHFPPH